MARPRRSTQDAFFDVFADMALEDQKASLRIMEQIHRLAVREEAKDRRTAEMPPPVEDRDEDEYEAKGRELFQAERCPPRE